MYYLYCHTNRTNGKKYFGVTSQRPTHRWNNGKAYSSCSRFYAAIQKYGWDGFTHEVLKEGLDETTAHEMEREYIKKYHTTDERYGYNQSTGGRHGSLGLKLSDEQKRQISKRFKGKPLTEEHKRKISEANKGKKRSEEQRKMMSDLRRGKKLSAETRRKMSEAHKGKQFSEETRRKISESKRKIMRPVYCVETDTTYESTQAAARALGVSQPNLYKACKGTTSHVGGYHVRFANPESE